ncbi:MAG: hypothetical protein A2Z88_10865 [Omnitrophica WOR_2 bacterium GWA2_47_8]|nr:MAG: hypothetical protein A2Z88_10865 [Omnitrophica WOR_2 bacterium GWA2_47_8]
MPTLVQTALNIALKAHAGAVRKADGSPYIVHPIMVAMKLARHGFSDAVVAAAFVHDVLEDTDYPEAQLRKELGDEVLAIVKAVTNDDSLPWEEKKKKYIETVRQGPEGAKAVAVADKIHNLESLFAAYERQGPEVWKRFNRGKDQKAWFEHEVLKMLKETWSHPLIAEYEALIRKEEALV